MSKELLSKFNQVLRPYYAQMTRPGISDLATLQDFLARFCADQQIIQLLAATNPETQELQDLLPGNNSAILGHFFKARLFQQQFSHALAVTLQQQAPSSELDAIGKFFTEKTQIATTHSNVYDAAQLASILCLLYARYASDSLDQAGIAHAYALPKAKIALDVTPDNFSPELFTSGEQALTTLYSVASNPKQFQALKTLQFSRDKIQEHTLMKRFLRAPVGMKVYFDPLGNAYLNRQPVGVQQQNFFATCTIASLLKESKADFLKFALNADTLHMFTHSENTKALNKSNVSVIVTCQQDEPSNAAARNAFDLHQEFDDCAAIISLVRYIQGLKKHYDLQLQFAANTYYRLQLACVPQAPQA